MKTGNKSELPIVLYDCFTNQRFGGNIGGIVLNAGASETKEMQQIAREINAPVTGFVTGQNGNEVSVRFFMPGAEIAMCGHVTVGLFTHIFTQAPVSGNNGTDYVMKVTAGDINVRVTANAGDLPNVMMQLSAPLTSACDVDLDALASALGVSSSALAVTAPIEMGDAGLKHLFVHFSSLSEVQALAPDFKKLAEVSNENAVHTVACFSMETEDPQNTLHIRDFCPAVGVDEVPASGTTNGALVGYLLKHGLISDQHQMIKAEQGSEIGRPSLICSEIKTQDRKITDLWVGGHAVASLKGILLS